MPTCDSICTHLRQGDFTLLAPAFFATGGQSPLIIQLHGDGCFDGRPHELAEAMTCAAFLGAADVLQYFLHLGLEASGGQATGMNALHWAVNRAQVDTTQLLLRHGIPLEVENMYGGTALGAACWAAIHESKAAHILIIEWLLAAGANVHAVSFPIGDEAVDKLLAQYGARVANGDDT